MVQQDARGRFAPGHTGGPGRPKRDGDDFQSIIARNVTPKDWDEITAAALRDAKGRGANAQKAREWLVDRMYGKVKEHLEIDDITGLVWDKETPPSNK